VARNRIHQSTGYKTRAASFFLAFYLFLLKCKLNVSFQHIEKREEYKISEFLHLIFRYINCDMNGAMLVYPQYTPVKKFFPLESVSVFHYLWSTSSCKEEIKKQYKRAFSFPKTVTDKKLFTEKLVTLRCDETKTKTHVCMTISV
jgi:hypothetical protein